MRTWAAAVVALLLAAALAGCSGVRQGSASSLDQAGSAVRTARLAVELDARGRSTHPVTATALDDALTKASQAQSGIAALGASTRVNRRIRDEAARAIDDAVRLLADARDAVDAGRAPAADWDRVEAELARATVATGEAP